MNADAARNETSADTQSEPLSRFEGWCLCRRTRECEELLQLAVLGVEGVQVRHGSNNRALSEIAALLREAKRAVEMAREIAMRWSQ